MSYIVLTGVWCHIVVLEIHAPTDSDVNESFYEKLEHVFNKFPNYQMTVLLGDLNAKVGKEDTYLADNWERKFTRN
jgi:hypothetical protein